MTVATYNVNGMQARLRFVLHWLAARGPDVALLQEIKLPDERFPHDELQAAGYRALVYGQKGWNGVAILTRERTVRRAEVLDRGLPGLEAQGARLIAAQVEGDGFGALDCASVYVPNGRAVDHPEFGHKLAFLDGLVSFAERESRPDRPLIIGGDFNLCPGAIDTWDEEAWRERIFHTAEERRRFRALLDLGLIDLFRARNPDLRRFSWWDYRAGNFHKNLGLRIDLLLASAPVAERTAGVTIDRDYRKKKDGMIASDHAPVIAEIAPPEGAGGP